MAGNTQLEMAGIVDQLPVRPSAEITPMTLIQVAVQNNYDLEKLKHLMELERQWKADRAKEAFDAAMAAFKAEDIHVTKDLTNKQYGSRYTGLGNLVGTVTPLLSKHGLSATWDIDQSAGIKVICKITHRLGHSGKPVEIIFPPDKSGAKNPLQEIKSAITYGKICTFESACGIASSDENVSDDGNGAASRMEGLEDWLEKFKECANPEELDREFRKAYSIASELKDEPARKLLVTAKDERRVQLRSKR